MVKTLAPLLRSIVLDASSSYSARAKSCLSLALLQFLGGEDSVGDSILLMQAFEGIFAGSYLKGDDTPSSATEQAAPLHAAALSAWALLLTLIPSGDLVSLIEAGQNFPSFKNLMGLLKSQHLEIRMMAGETIALLLESGRSHDENFLEDYIDELIESTKELATDSQKFRAKRDRRQQKATFRDVVHYIEDEEFSSIEIQIGAGINKDKLEIDSWAVSHQYNSICNVLGSGMSIHLLDNEFLRDVFELSERLDASQMTAKNLNKSEKRALQAASFKHRTLTRGKNRDKRSAVVT